MVAWALGNVRLRQQVIPLPDEATTTGNLGLSIFTSWVIPFEVVSFVLLAALIGGITLARRDDTLRVVESEQLEEQR